MTTEDAPQSSPTAMRQIIPTTWWSATVPVRSAPGLLARRGQGPVQSLPLNNGAGRGWSTGFEEARTVLADPRFSADKIRHREATSLQPHEVADCAQAPRPGLRRSREDGFFVFMDPPEPPGCGGC